MRLALPVAASCFRDACHPRQNRALSGSNEEAVGIICTKQSINSSRLVKSNGNKEETNRRRQAMLLSQKGALCTARPATALPGRDFLALQT